MRIPLTLLFLLITVATMGIVHHVAIQFFLYWHFPLLDMPMHLLGGIVAGLGYLVFAEMTNLVPQRFCTLVPVLVVTFLVGTVWEVFEYYAVGVPINISDITIDYGFDIVGGVIAYVLAKHLRTL
jgi:hypothetical protein